MKSIASSRNKSIKQLKIKVNSIVRYNKFKLQITLKIRKYNIYNEIILNNKKRGLDEIQSYCLRLSVLSLSSHLNMRRN